jgi:predicted Zn finger-like uncharacterized protein
VSGLGSAMSSADLATVMIACPHCGTRYQVPFQTIGSDGREVQCAQCGKSWHATAQLAPAPALVPAADPDQLFPTDETALDFAFETEEKAVAPATFPHPGSLELNPDHERTLSEIRAAIAPKARKGNVIDPKTLSKARESFSRRQKTVVGKLPLARMRRTARLGALVLLLSMLILGFSLRGDLVRWFPQLAGLYAAIGLPVNVVGLQFEDSKTINTLREGKIVMQISAKIRSIDSHTVSVPPVLVSLLNDKGQAVYEWTVAPSLAEMDPGEVMSFTTEVNSPPDGAVSVRLTFATKAS